MPEKECEFCKIVQKKLPCYKVYEDASFLAFLDINPVNPGHTQFVPKKHFKTILDMDDKLLAKAIITAKKVSKTLMKGVNAQGFNIIISCNEAANQTIPHAHFHILPRFDHENRSLFGWETKETSPEELDSILKKIKGK